MSRRDPSLGIRVTTRFSGSRRYDRFVTISRRRFRAAAFAAALFLVCASGCRRAAAPAAASAKTKATGDALFLAAAPVWVPDENDAELSAMGIGRLYVAAAALRKDGKLVPLAPPPTRLSRPVFLAVMGEPSAAAVLASGGGETLGAGWAKSLVPVLAEAKGWGEIAGIHLHLDLLPENAPALADAIRAMKAGLGNLPVSVTLRGTEPPASWKPLAGVADEALLFCFGRRPELGDRVVAEISDETAKEMPLPFRLLIAPGGFGRTGDGRSFLGRWLADGEVAGLSSDHTLDFSFGQVLSEEAGSIYTFRIRPGSRVADSRLLADGGAARFQVLSFSEAVRLLGLASRWGSPRLLGRVFLIEGIPRDPHLVGYAAVRDLLTGKPLPLKLQVEALSGSPGAGWAEFSLRVTNTSVTPSDLSRQNNWVQVRVEGGVFSSIRLGEFDRFELLSSQAEGYRPATLGQAVVARLFENLFAPGEAKETDAIRVNGSRPKIFVSWHLTGPDGKIFESPETEAAFTTPAARPGRR